MLHAVYSRFVRSLWGLETPFQAHFFDLTPDPSPKERGAKHIAEEHIFKMVCAG
jgi:hypothetical protein